MDIKLIADKIKKLHEKNKIFLIAIDGRSGSGKSYVAKKLMEELPNSTLIQVDSFDMYEGKTNVQKFIDTILKPLRKDIEGDKIVILEGIFSLKSELISYYDFKIWVECPAEIGFKRGLKRDFELNGIDNSQKWINYWIPKEEEYIRKEEPQKKADYIIDGAAK